MKILLIVLCGLLVWASLALYLVVRNVNVCTDHGFDGIKIDGTMKISCFSPTPTN